MKIKTYYLILVVTAVFFRPPVICYGEQSPSGAVALSNNRPHPAFAGIDKLHVVVLQYGAEQDKAMPILETLEASIKEKLSRSGIKSDTPAADNILIIPELRIYISTFGIEDTTQLVFHIRTALARAVCLKGKQHPVFKADIWQSAPIMQIVSAENKSDNITDAIQKQVENFISIYYATNPTGAQSSDTGTNEITPSSNPAEQEEKNADSAEPGYYYVASKSSNVFHKPDCRWAGNISKENLIKYKNREQAIKAGKRPCKTCNP